jgi:hypothetical protein
VPARARAAGRRRLTWRQDLELSLVPQLRSETYASAFDSEEHRYEAWLVHRERLLERLRAPFGYLLYEAPEDVLAQLGERTAAALRAAPTFAGDDGRAIF